MRNSGRKFFKKYNLEQFTSVRAMQSMLDMSVNAKIPDDLVHKLSFEHFRIKFQCLERLWFNFKNMVFLLWFWWYSKHHF